MDEPTIYLDYAATTPVDPAVRDAMLECLSPDGAFGNPSSDHAVGARARDIIEHARRVIAERVSARPEGLVFTSGATEANNLALQGMFAPAARGGAHLVTSVLEHHSVLDSARYLATQGVDVTFLECDAYGRIAPEAVAAALRDETRLVSIMQVNNEIGTAQDIEAIASVCRQRGVALHVDAAQSACKVPLDIEGWGIDLCSMTAHKLCGPKGAGVLYVRPGLSLAPLFHGGEQERRLRPGTLATHQIAGLGKAFELAGTAAETAGVAALRERLWTGLAQMPGIVRNGDPVNCAPHILSVSFPGVDGESLRLALGNVAVSQGSACASDSPEASHVLSAIGLSDARAHGTLRFGLGRFTTEAEVDLVVERLNSVVPRLTALAADAPSWCRA